MLPRTTTQLLQSLKEPANQSLWQQFDERYRPVLVAIARAQGLSDDEATEVAQLTLCQFASEYTAGRYDRGRGRLSSWILGIARNRINDQGRARQKQRGQLGETALVNLADERSITQAWETARQRVIFERALEVLRSDTRMDHRTIKAFELCAIRDAPAEAAAEECGMTVAEVYVAKNRAIKKLREIVAQFTQEFDDE